MLSNANNRRYKPSVKLKPGGKGAHFLMCLFFTPEVSRVFRYHLISSRKVNFVAPVVSVAPRSLRASLIRGLKLIILVTLWSPLPLYDQLTSADCLWLVSELQFPHLLFLAQDHILFCLLLVPILAPLNQPGVHGCIHIDGFRAAAAKEGKKARLGHHSTVALLCISLCCRPQRGQN